MSDMAESSKQSGSNGLEQEAKVVKTPRKELRVFLERCNGSLSPSPSPSKRSKGPTEEEKETLHRKPVDLIGRKEQLRVLNAVFGEGLSPKLPGCVFLWGATSSGKSHTLDLAVEGKNLHVLRIHCAEILCGRRAFYETLVKQLVSRTTSLAPDFKCDSLHSLYSNFYEYLTKDNEKRALRVVIIVEGAENLRGEHDDILRFLVSFQDIVQSALCVVFISTLPPSQFMPNIMDHSIIPLYFPQYTMDELTQILVQEQIGRGGSIKASFYPFYVKMIVSMFYFACRDLRKLSRLARSHWDKFEEMAENSSDRNFSRLWKKLEPDLKAQFFELNSVLSSIPIGGDTKRHDLGKKFEMPLNAKYLLIASYLATHNPASSDKRFFVKTKIGKSKKSRVALKTELKSFVRAFELNRLNAIFGSIQTYCDDETVNKNRNISFMCLLTTLCQNKLIQHIGEDSFGNQKYRCLLDYDTVLEISRSVNFELNNYLFRLL